MAKTVYRMRPNESLVIGLIYLAALLPLWGILIAWVTRESWRLRSRHVVIHATQAIWFQVGLLLAFVAYACAQVFCNALYRVQPSLSELLSVANLACMAFAAAVYAATCLVVAWLTLDGRDVRLPLIGERIHAQEYEEEGE